VVPNDENWIIQGTLGPDGVPVKLNARISSGSAVDFSEASIVVRHVRFSGQIAPHDQQRPARDYGWMDDPLGGPTTLGGAFSYDGGGLKPGVHTPQLIFEIVVFDRNRAVAGSAVWIAGRQGTMSGLKLVVDGCLFFRNVASYRSALCAINSCPSTLLVNNSDFIHNEAFVVPSLWIGEFDTKVGVAGQRHSWTVANSHFEGPMWSFAAIGVCFLVHVHSNLGTTDGTIHDALAERVTVIDAKGDLDNGAILCHSAGARPLNCRIRGCHVARVMGAYTGLSMRSPLHSTTVTLTGCNYSEVSQLALEDSGAFQDESFGEGVLHFADSYVALAHFQSTNEYRVLDSTFVRNKAARGAAIGWVSIKARLTVQQCSFEVRYSLC
jgi:hypothetical protein